MPGVTAYTFHDIRDARFGEILVVKPMGVEIYNTTGLNKCPAELSVAPPTLTANPVTR